jgi:L-glyceraldehyde 3-phosphate reductase
MHTPNPDRYSFLPYRTVSWSTGLKLPPIALGFWHNFGYERPFDEVRETVLTAFDSGITHFDLANNYGRPAGSAETNLGRILREDLWAYRDELVISTKAGFDMWEGPYGCGGSRKYLMASLDQSLKRLGIPYVDVFYHHVYDPSTPLYETMQALSDIRQSGKALYVGLSNYPKDKLEEAIALLKAKGVTPIMYQPHFSLLDRGVKEDGQIELCKKEGVGVIPYSIFNQGLLTNRYLETIPEDSRMADANNPFLTERAWSDSMKKKLHALNDYAGQIGRSLTEAALRYVLDEDGVSAALIGVSRTSQLLELIELAKREPLSTQERNKLESIAKEI